MKKNKKIICMFSLLIIASCGTSCNNTDESTSNITEEYKLNFMETEDKVTETLVVKEDENLKYPNVTKVEEGSVFIGWDNIEGPITEDKDIKANYVELNDKPNVFTMPTVYGDIDSEIIIPLELNGAIDMCAFDITLKYDTEKIRLLEIANVDTGVISNYDSVKGEIYMNYVQASNINAGFKICDFIFETGEFVGDTSLEVSNLEVVKSFENGDLSYVESEVVIGYIRWD